MFFFTVLAVCWFLVYWIIGGVFFACVALLKLKKIHKVRFSCFFSLSSALCAAGAVWLGFRLAGEGARVRLSGETSIIKEVPGTIFSCGFLHFLISMLIGLVVLVILGFGILKLSARKDRGWLTVFAERLEWDKSRGEEGRGDSNK